MLPRELGERLPRPDFEHHVLLILQQFAHAVREPHRLAHMAGPVLRIACVLFRHPFRRHVRDIGNLRRLEMNLFEQLGERSEHRVHHRRMKCVRSVQPPARDFFSFKFALQFFHRVMRPGNHAEIR